MRIDYSEPKKSSSAQSGQARPKSGSSRGILVYLLITAVICLGLGFAGGWVVSQKSAKRTFKAAMEQQSLENSPRKVIIPAAQQPAPVLPLPNPSATGQQPDTSLNPAAKPGQPESSPAPADPQLSFYKTLPGAQKPAVLGSGINTREDKTAKQPLQAAIPANIVKTPPATNQSEEDLQKQIAQLAAQKSAPRQEAAGARYTVQLSSFSLKSEAEALRSKLAAKGYSVTISETRLGDKGTWYRVRVGRQLTHDAAKEIAQKFGRNAMVIPDAE